MSLVVSGWSALFLREELECFPKNRLQMCWVGRGGRSRGTDAHCTLIELQQMVPHLYVFSLRKFCPVP
ncbi:hypothetical protein NDU88_003468 [Pleurodeles waltl]|uniref:Uncharacterized protein n=1 Tax=Pleurodeles waltl TaxID=8319 RepID=A0AAV7KY77_PLEWA|nr:hypothetical protein NDU88_003468 [Pleurodeles waltl]